MDTGKWQTQWTGTSVNRHPSSDVSCTRSRLPPGITPLGSDKKRGKKKICAIHAAKSSVMWSKFTTGIFLWRDRNLGDGLLAIVRP